MGVTEARGKAGEASGAPRTRYSSSSFSCWSCRRNWHSFSRASRARSRSSESCLWMQTGSASPGGNSRSAAAQTNPFLQEALLTWAASLLQGPHRPVALISACVQEVIRSLAGGAWPSQAGSSGFRSAPSVSCVTLDKLFPLAKYQCLHG